MHQSREKNKQQKMLVKKKTPTTISSRSPSHSIIVCCNLCESTLISETTHTVSAPVRMIHYGFGFLLLAMRSITSTSHSQTLDDHKQVNYRRFFSSSSSLKIHFSSFPRKSPPIFFYLEVKISFRFEIRTDFIWIFRIDFYPLMNKSP